jgi:hypothetical protein
VASPFSALQTGEGVSSYSSKAPLLVEAP